MLPLAAKLALSPLLVAQALLARRRVPRLPEAAGPRSGAVGRGPALKLLVVGDSSAAGVGVVHQREALAAQLAAQVAASNRVWVHWRLVARSGEVRNQRLTDLADRTVVALAASINVWRNASARPPEACAAPVALVAHAGINTVDPSVPLVGYGY